MKIVNFDTILEVLSTFVRQIFLQPWIACFGDGAADAPALSESELVEDPARAPNLSVTKSDLKFILSSHYIFLKKSLN